ncbi:MAG: QacE family quaternary ammonium compound efflux SMR transporter [Clostridium sp.]|nr:QacE family quaternary ammonium compound efflux SMR transporter [Clostridium sp.]
MEYIYLAIAIISEIFATTMLKDTNGFTVLIPSILTIAGYALSFYMLSLSIQTLPTGIIYAIWSGVGIVGIALLGWLVHKQVLDTPAIIGILLILCGVLIIKIFSKTVA